MVSAENLLKYSKQEYSRITEKTYSSDLIEVEYRNCARIAYYSLFHRLSAIADSLPGEYEKNTGDHQRVIKKLMDYGNEEQKVFAEEMKNNRALRVKADYFIGERFTKNDAYKALRYAEKIFDKTNTDSNLSIG